MTSRTITLVTAQDSLDGLEGSVGMLVEYAPDAKWVPESAVPIEELLGSAEDAKRQAAEFVLALIDGEPEIDGVRHLYALKEILIRAAFQNQLTVQLDGWLRKNGIEHCVFRSHSQFASALRELQLVTVASYKIETPPAVRRGKLQAAREHLRLKGTAALSELPRMAVQRLFPLRARMLQRHRSGPVSAADWWFYSTFHTFTNIGLAYERALGRKFRFFTELRGSAENPLRQGGRDWDELYAFAEKGDIPKKRELEEAQRKLRAHLENAASKDATAKALLLRSQMVQELISRLLPLALLQTRVLRRWMENTVPALIVVGNEAWEGGLLQLAAQRGVPTVVLQHGIFGDFYQVTEHSGNVIVARGEFWRDFLSEGSRRHSVVLNCDAPCEGSVPTRRGDDLLFVATDYRVMPTWHAEDLHDIMAAAANAAFEAKRRLVVRVHPRDSVEPYKKALARICTELGIEPQVEFSSGAGLDDAIRKSAVALLYSSTVFLDCLRLGVPIVSPGWHDFAFKNMMSTRGVFQFARDLKHLRTLLADGISHKLAASKSYEQFLAPTKPDEVRAFFEQCAAGKKWHA